MQPNDVGIVAKVVADAIQKVTAPLLREIEILKARQPERGEKGERGEPGPVGLKGEIGDAGVDGRDGIDADPIDLPALAKSAAALIPIPKDGADGHPGKDGRDGIDGKDGAIGVQGERGADGLSGKDGADGLNGKDGRDGVDGKDGAAGIHGRDGLPGVPGRDGESGRNGKDGVDGLGFDDLAVEHDGERAFTIKVRRGEIEKTFGSFVIPAVIDRGVFRDGTVYQCGDGVTWAGSFFIAQRDTKAKPETSSDWRLAIKRGRDGKDGKPGPQGPQGPKA